MKYIRIVYAMKLVSVHIAIHLLQSLPQYYSFYSAVVGDGKIYQDDKSDALYPTLDWSELIYDNLNSISVTVSIAFYLKLKEIQVPEISFEHKSVNLVFINLSLETCNGAKVERS